MSKSKPDLTVDTTQHRHIVAPRVPGSQFDASGFKLERAGTEPREPIGDAPRLIWVACIVHDYRHRTLMAERLSPGSIDQGMYGPPGGKVHDGESLIDAARREFREETLCELRRPILLGINDSDLRGLVVFVGGEIDDEPQRAEPDKHGPWGWYGVDDDIPIQGAVRDLMVGHSIQFSNAWYDD